MKILKRKRIRMKPLKSRSDNNNSTIAETSFFTRTFETNIIDIHSIKSVRTHHFSKAFKNTTLQLTLISFSFIALNLPYFISWSYFYIDYFYQSDQNEFQNNFFSYVQIAKIFHVLNYCIKFYIMFATVKNFRKLFLN